MPGKAGDSHNRDPADLVAEDHVIAAEEIARIDGHDPQEDRVAGPEGMALTSDHPERTRNWKAAAARNTHRSCARSQARA